MIRYQSTRGAAPVLDFEDVVLAGLASDGGLYVPESIPVFSLYDIAAMQGLSYVDLAVEVIGKFTDGAISREDLKEILTKAYAPFRHAAIAPLKQIAENEFVLELFHGPTLAFKDFALQFLGHLLDTILAKRQQKIVIVGATSGDTGSAAIAGCQGRDNIDIFILHPKGRVSEVQRRQMTTVADKNVHNIALEGTFDDCQDIVKALFADADFRAQHALVAVNSINWARIMAQVVYYFYAALSLGAPARAVSFSVPTGNFGDIYAGHIARAMGLPIASLIIATNKNDILARTLATGTYGMAEVVPTLSPSMDIQISSNFERLLFDLYGGNGEVIAALMQRLRAEKQLELHAEPLDALRAAFQAASADDALTKETIAEVYKTTGELLDPHTAVGVAAARSIARNKAVPMVTLATAHPAKFPDAVKAATGVTPELPNHLADLHARVEKYETLSNNVNTVKEYITRTI